MKKIISIILIVFVGIIFCCCKKKSSSSTSTTGPTTNLSIDGAAVTGLSHSSYSTTTNFIVLVYGNSGNPEVQLTFLNASTPSSGSYLIIPGTPSYGQCNFSLSNSTGNSIANNGSVTVSGGAPGNNSVTFSNISVSGSGGAHTVSGTVYY